MPPLDVPAPLPSDGQDYTQTSQTAHSFMDRVSDRGLEFLEGSHPLIHELIKNLKIAGLLNEDGLRDIHVELRGQMHHFINLGNYTTQEIADTVCDIKAGLNGKFFLKYTQWGIKDFGDWESVLRIVGNNVRSSYNRALNQSEKTFLAKTHSSVEKVEQAKKKSGLLGGLTGVFTRGA